MARKRFYSRARMTSAERTARGVPGAAGGIVKFADAVATGRIPETTASLEHRYRERERNGFAPAFVVVPCVGTAGRVQRFVDLDAYLRILRSFAEQHVGAAREPATA